MTEALHPRDSSGGARRGESTRRPLGRELLRLARRQRGRQAARGARATRDLLGARPRSRTRAPRTCASRRSSTATGSRSCAKPARPVQRPLWASTGVKNPHYPDTMYVDELVAPDTVNTMPMPTLLAAGEHAEITRRHRRRRRGRGRGGDEAAGRGRASTWSDVTKKLLDEGVDLFVEALEKLIAGVEQRARGDRHRPPGDDRARSSRTSSSPRSPSGSGRRPSRTSRSASGARTTRSGARPARPRSADRLGWLTISEPMLEQARDLSACADEVKRDGLTDCALLGMGGSSPRPRGDPALVRPARARPQAARARLDRPGRGRRARERARPLEDALPRLVEVGRDDRDAVALPLLLRDGRAGTGRSVRRRSPIPAARSKSSPRRTASGGCSGTTPTSAAATRCCPTSGSCPRPSWA